MKTTHRPAAYHGDQARKQRGITLIEACVVIAITAVLGGAAAPSLRGLIDNRRIDGAATTLATDIQFVRTEAVARNQALRLSWHEMSDGSCYVIHTGNAAQCACNASGPATCIGGAQELRTVLLPSNDRVRLQTNVSSMLVDPLHGTVSPTGTLRLIGDDTRSVNHVVNIMGRVRSCSPLAAVPGYRSC